MKYNIVFSSQNITIKIANIISINKNAIYTLYLEFKMFRTYYVPHNILYTKYYYFYGSKIRKPDVGTRCIAKVVG